MEGWLYDEDSQEWWAPSYDGAWIIIPCKSGKTIEHQWNGHSCDQFRIEGLAAPVKIPQNILNSWGHEIEDEFNESPEERMIQFNKAARLLSEFFGVPCDRIEVMGEALVKVGDFYLIQGNSD